MASNTSSQEFDSTLNQTNKSATASVLHQYSDVHIIFTTCPKPFIDSNNNPTEWNQIQQNAIKSWTNALQMVSNVSGEVWLLADELGVKEFADELKYNTLQQDVKRSPQGTPLVDDLIAVTNTIGNVARTRYPNKRVLCCFINTDIVIDIGFIRTIQNWCFRAYDRRQPISGNYLLVGQRYDIAIDNIERITNIFDDVNSSLSPFAYQSVLEDIAYQEGDLHSGGGIDYFIFAPNLFKFVHPFAIGKFFWDRWLLGNAFRRGIPTVDITNTVIALHQNGGWLGEGHSIHSREKVMNLKETIENHSFDYYEKTIQLGTNYISYFDPVSNSQDWCKFKLKELLPDED